jgi:hypothetical protein
VEVEVEDKEFVGMKMEQKAQKIRVVSESEKMELMLMVVLMLEEC